jgi:hypothetical protein
MFFLPESPHILMYWGRQEEASHVLSRIRGVAEDHPDVANTIRDIDLSIKLERSVQLPWWKVLFWDSVNFLVVA